MMGMCGLGGMWRLGVGVGDGRFGCAGSKTRVTGKRERPFL